ncbi:MAG TPA: hypothetical protein IAB52_02625 [Candidatus Scatomonas merdavium]|nr:hypothetical protein [Candidatus Scatomonas merdavium]
MKCPCHSSPSLKYLPCVSSAAYAVEGQNYYIIECKSRAKKNVNICKIFCCTLKKGQKEAAEKLIIEKTGGIIKGGPVLREGALAYEKENYI